MPRIDISRTVSDAPKATQLLLKAEEAQSGTVSNLLRITANSPASLTGYLQLNTALNEGLLPISTRERIALAIAELNACDYCLASHSYMGRTLANLSSEEMCINRRGTSLDAKAASAVEFAVTIARQRGHTSKADFAAVRSAGFSDAEIVEIITHVALNTLTNYLNSSLQTEIDFPSVDNLCVA